MENEHTTPLEVYVTNKEFEEMTSCMGVADVIETPGTLDLAIPEHLGECTDMLMTLKIRRAERAREDKEDKMHENSIKDYIQGELESQGLTSSSGKRGCVTLSTKNRYTVGDKPAFLKHILETDGYDLFTATAVTAAAMHDRASEGEEVPGVNCFEQTLIKLTKRKV